MCNRTDINAGIYERICACKNVKAQKHKNVKAQMCVYAFTHLPTCMYMQRYTCLRVLIYE